MTDAQVIRSMLLSEIAAIRDGAVREERTQRNVWYSLVKPTLSHLGLLRKTTKGGRPVPWPNKLSRYLAELVRSRGTSYEQLSIVDGSRQRVVGVDSPYVILFTEKDTIWNVIKDLALLYGVSAISGGGMPSFACTEHTLRAIARSPAYEGQEIVLLTLTDHDPAGYKISNAQLAQVQNVISSRISIHHERLGIVPNQLSPEEQAANAYQLKSSDVIGWVGVPGHPGCGLELDALPISRIREIFIEGIERFVDLSTRQDVLRREFLEQQALIVLQPKIAAMVQELLSSVSDDVLEAIDGCDPLTADLNQFAGQVKKEMQ